MDRLVYALGFVVIVACGAIVMATGQALPPVVASHFAANGVAGSFMPRDDYVHFMAALTTLVPLGVAALLAVFLMAIHLIVVAANHRQPPSLASGPFIAALVGFLVAMGVWAISLSLRFRRPPPR